MSHSKSYTDIYPAKVVSVDDPQKLGRVKVQVYDIFDNVPVDNLPWASTNLSLGARAGEGLVTPMQVGDEVWVRFNNGSTRYPIVTGATHSWPDGSPNLPADALQGDGYTHKRTENQPQVEEAGYYEDVVYKQNNALIQLTRAGNIRITQMTSGSAIELLPSGDIVIHCEGDLYMSVAGTTLQELTGDVTQNISGNVTQSVSGNVDQSVSGNLETSVDGDYTLTVGGAMTLTSSGAAEVGSSGSSLTLTTSGAICTMDGGQFTMDGPARFNNGVSAKSIKADTTIVAPSIYEGATTSTPDA